MIPTKFFAEIEKCKHAKNRQRNDFLDDLELERRVHGAAPTVGRNLETIFKESNAPAHHDDQPQRRTFKFQMPVPGEGHEGVGTDEQQDGQPAGRSDVIHINGGHSADSLRKCPAGPPGGLPAYAAILVGILSAFGVWRWTSTMSSSNLRTRSSIFRG